MRLPSLAFVLCLCAPAVSQVQDVGLTVDPANTGQMCGPVSCTPINAGAALRGSVRTFLHASAPITPFVLGIGLPGSCVAFPGIDNGLLLDPVTLQVVAAGVTSHEPTIATPCQQGLAVWVMSVPNSAPVGLQFRVQGLGVSNSGQVGFGPALELTIQ